MRILFYIRIGGDAVAALFGPFSVNVVEPKTPHLGLIKEAALAFVAEEFVDELANPVVVPLVHFVHSGADDTPVISPVGFQSSARVANIPPHVIAATATARVSERRLIAASKAGSPSEAY